MPDIKRYAALFSEALEALDALGDDNEDLEELNAEFEDAIFALSSIDPDAEDAGEELADTMDEMDALCDDYRNIPGAAGAVSQMEALIREIRAGLGKA